MISSDFDMRFSRLICTHRTLLFPSLFASLRSCAPAIKCNRVMAHTSRSHRFHPTPDFNARFHSASDSLSHQFSWSCMFYTLQRLFYTLQRSPIWRLEIFPDPLPMQMQHPTRSTFPQIPLPRRRWGARRQRGGKVMRCCRASRGVPLHAGVHVGPCSRGRETSGSGYKVLPVEK